MNNHQIGAHTGMTPTWENAFFAQDDWRAARRLTLNLGVRNDVLTSPFEVFGRQSNFNLATGALQVAKGGGDSLVNTNYPCSFIIRSSSAADSIPGLVTPQVPADSSTGQITC